MINFNFLFKGQKLWDWLTDRPVLVFAWNKQEGIIWIEHRNHRVGKRDLKGVARPVAHNGWMMDLMEEYPIGEK